LLTRKEKDQKRRERKKELLPLVEETLCEKQNENSLSLLLSGGRGLRSLSFSHFFASASLLATDAALTALFLAIDSERLSRAALRRVT
jgi:hypothetical protein